MAHDFVVAFDHDVVATELVFQVRVGALVSAVFAVVHGVGRLEVFLFIGARIMVGQRHTPANTEVLSQNDLKVKTSS